MRPKQTMTRRSPSIYWYDLETTGTQPKWDRIIQFAGIRTSEDLQETGEQMSFFVRLSEDVLPDPAACLVTGLSPQKVNEEGLSEPLALRKINEQFSEELTCVAGYNSLRFDDEFIRFGFYRNFIDPYAREWQNDNSRWDVIDLVRATAALRPDGIEWPLEDGLVTFRLEELTKANNLEHGQAHDALSDVRATIELARLVRMRQRRLYEYFYGMRKKSVVQLLLTPLRERLLLHVSRMYPRERHCLAPVVSIAQHPVNSNSFIVLDLDGDITPVLEWPAEELSRLLFEAGSHYRPPLKEVRLNRCPFLAPISTLRESDETRLGINMQRVRENLQKVTDNPALESKIKVIYDQKRVFQEEDVESQLYNGFITAADRRGCDGVLKLFSADKDPGVVSFEDSRLKELLFRFRARNCSSSLNPSEQQRWREYIERKLCTTEGPSTGGLDRFFSEIENLERSCESPLLSELRRYGEQLSSSFCSGTSSADTVI